MEEKVCYYFLFLRKLMKDNATTPMIASVIVPIFILSNSFLNNANNRYNTNPALSPNVIE